MQRPNAKYNKTLGILLYALNVKEIIRNQLFDIIITDAVTEIQKEEMY